MAAVDCVMNLLEAGDHIVTGDDIYGGTYRYLLDVAKRRGITFDFVRYSPSMVESHPDAACAVGRFWFWFVAPMILLVFYSVVVGILWSPTNNQIEREGKHFRYFGQWSLIWAIALSLFPIFYRVLWSGGFSCYSSARIWQQVSFASLQSNNNNNTSSSSTANSPLPIINEPSSSSSSSSSSNSS